MRKFCLPTGQGLPIGRILNSEDLLELIRVEEFLAAAKAEEEQRVAEGLAQAEVERNKAYQAAYEDGMSSFLKAIDRVRHEEANIKLQLRDLLEKCLILLLGAEKVPDVFEKSIGRILNENEAIGPLEVTVHPSQVVAVREAWDALPDIFPATPVTVLGDETLNDRQGMVFSAKDVFDISLDVQLDKLICVLGVETAQSQEVAHDASSMLDQIG